jgi:hypothetical protein
LPLRRQGERPRNEIEDRRWRLEFATVRRYRSERAFAGAGEHVLHGAVVRKHIGHNPPRADVHHHLVGLRGTVVAHRHASADRHRDELPALAQDVRNGRQTRVDQRSRGNAARRGGKEGVRPSKYGAET